MPRIMIDLSYPFRLKLHWTMLGLDNLMPDEVYFGRDRNEASSVSTNRVAHRVGRRGYRGAAPGTVDNPPCSSSPVAYEILSNKPGPLLWS